MFFPIWMNPEPLLPPGRLLVIRFFAMAHCRLNAIWANYSISPDPASGALSLHEACRWLTEYSLQPEDIVEDPKGGFMLHADLGRPLLDVCATMDSLLKLTMKHHGQSSYSIGTTLPQILTGTTEVNLQAPHCQILSEWVLLLNRLMDAIQRLKDLCIGDPHSCSHLEQRSRFPQLVALLSPILQVKLRPCNFVWWNMPVPSTVREAAVHAHSTTISTSVGSHTHSNIVEVQTSTSEAARTTVLELETGMIIPPPEKSPVGDAGVAMSTAMCLSAAVNEVGKRELPTGMPLEMASCSARRSVDENSISKEDTVKVSGLAPIAATPAAVKDPICTIEPGGHVSAESVIPHDNEPLTTWNLDKGQILCAPIAEESASQLHRLRSPSLCGLQALPCSPGRVSKLVERFEAIATGRGMQSQASSSHPDDAAPWPRLPYTAKTKMVEIGGLERQLQAACSPHMMPLCGVDSEQVLTFGKRGDTQSPAPALIFEEPAVKRGVLSDLLPTNGQQPAEASIEAVLTSEVGSNPSRIASTDMSAPPPAPTVPATVNDPLNQSPCLPLLAAEHESVALVAAIDEAVDELGGLQKDLGGRRSHEKLFIAEAAQFPALVHVLEDGMVELGGPSAASLHGTIDSRKVDSETDEQCVGWKEEKMRILTHLYGTLNSPNLNSLEPPRTLGEFIFKTASAGSWSERRERNPQTSSLESHLVFNSCSCGQLGTPRGCLQHGNAIRHRLVHDSSTPRDEAKRMCIGGAEECEASQGSTLCAITPVSGFRTATDCVAHASSALGRRYAWDAQGTPNHHHYALVWARTRGSQDMHSRKPSSEACIWIPSRTHRSAVLTWLVDSNLRQHLQSCATRREWGARARLLQRSVWPNGCFIVHKSTREVRPFYFI
ncbi:hypothetical protein B0H14DRAFT_2596377 [Mycena olivaceomarginata]|nr:hypothetical protein B0H14DRAFT_2596377 [Mycena olivaceomarginata]